VRAPPAAVRGVSWRAIGTILSDALRKASISHEIIGFREALRRGVFVRSRPWPLPGVQDLPEPRRAPAARTRHAGRPGDAREGLGMAGRIPGNSFLQVPIWNPVCPLGVQIGGLTAAITPPFSAALATCSQASTATAAGHAPCALTTMCPVSAGK
jgi:hypothetical protein